MRGAIRTFQESKWITLRALDLEGSKLSRAAYADVI